MALTQKFDQYWFTGGNVLHDLPTELKNSNNNKDTQSSASKKTGKYKPGKEKGSVNSKWSSLSGKGLAKERGAILVEDPNNPGLMVKINQEKKETDLPKDARFDENGELKWDKKLNVRNLIGGSVTGNNSVTGVGVNGSNSTYYNPENNKTYGDAMSDHMLVVTEKGAGNPFRPDVKLSMKTSFNKLKPLNPRDPLEYKSEVSYKRVGSMNIVIKADTTIKEGDVPTRSEVHQSTAKIARKALLLYDTRIVETGALLRALNRYVATGCSLQGYISMPVLYYPALGSS